MNKFWVWVQRRLIRAMNEDGCMKGETVGLNQVVASAEKFQNTMTINVTPASGGVVVSLYHYDRNTDRRNEQLYVIPEAEPFAEKLADIVSLETLRMR